MQNNKIDYVAQPDAISQITCDSRQQKRARAQDAIVASRRAQKIIKHGHRGGDRQHDEEPASEGPTFLQLTESDAAILRVNEIEEATNNGSITTKPERAYRPCLTGLVNHVDAKAGEQITSPPTEAGTCAGCQIRVVESSIHISSKTSVEIFARGFAARCAVAALPPISGGEAAKPNYRN